MASIVEKGKHVITKLVRLTDGNISMHHLQYLIKWRAVTSQQLRKEGETYTVEVSAPNEASIFEALNQARDHGFVVEELPDQQD